MQSAAEDNKAKRPRVRDVNGHEYQEDRPTIRAMNVFTDWLKETAWPRPTDLEKYTTEVELHSSAGCYSFLTAESTAFSMGKNASPIPSLCPWLNPNPQVQILSNTTYKSKLNGENKLKQGKFNYKVRLGISPSETSLSAARCRSLPLSS